MKAVSSPTVSWRRMIAYNSTLFESRRGSCRHVTSNVLMLQRSGRWAVAGGSQYETRARLATPGNIETAMWRNLVQI